MKLTDKQKNWLRCHADIVFERLDEHESPRDHLEESTALAVIQDFEGGNEWAWFTAKVSVTWGHWEGVDYLGCCSYRSMREFKEDAYYTDMVACAFDELVRAIESDMTAIEEIGELA